MAKPVSAFYRSSLGFWRDRRGNFAAMTAIAAVPILFSIGGVIDLSLYHSGRTKIQNGSDAAALAIARRFSDPDEGRLKALAQDYFDANTGTLFRTETTLNYEGVKFNENNVRELTLSVDYSYRPLFLGLFTGPFAGMNGNVAQVRSVIAIGNTTVEMAMVLDTSGSMDQTPSAGGAKKIVTLRRVAASAIDRLYQASDVGGKEEPVRISVVPFSGAVNLGVPLNTSWLDPKGLHPNHHTHLDWWRLNYTPIGVDHPKSLTGLSDEVNANQIAIRDPRSSLPMDRRPWVRKDNTTTYLTRQYILANLAGTSINWNDKLGVNSCPRGKAYNVGTICNWTGSATSEWRLTTVSGGKTTADACRQSQDSSCHPPYTINKGSNYFTTRVCAEMRSGQYSLTDETPAESKPESMFLPYFAPDEYDLRTAPSFGNAYLKDKGYPGASGWFGYAADRGWQHPLGAYPLNDYRQDDEYAIISQNDVRRYLMNPVRLSTTLGANNVRSPYFICDSDPIIPLAASPDKARAAVSSLTASGATNVEEGLGWGWRTLTPSEPFTGGRPRGDEKNYKAVVLMTDGANTYYPNNALNGSGYGAYGFVSEKRIFENTSLDPNSSSSYTSANLTRAMDERTAKLCENIKNDGRVPVTTARGDAVHDAQGRPISRDGVLVYTIAFDIPATDKPRVDKLLQDCASGFLSDQRQGIAPAGGRKYFYSASNDADLQKAFDDIVASLSSLRIAR